MIEYRVFWVLYDRPTDFVVSMGLRFPLQWATNYGMLGLARASRNRSHWVHFKHTQRNLLDTSDLTTDQIPIASWLSSVSSESVCIVGFTCILLLLYFKVTFIGLAMFLIHFFGNFVGLVILILLFFSQSHLRSLYRGV